MIKPIPLCSQSNFPGFQHLEPCIPHHSRLPTLKVVRPKFNINLCKSVFSCNLSKIHGNSSEINHIFSHFSFHALPGFDIFSPRNKASCKPDMLRSQSNIDFQMFILNHRKSIKVKKFEYIILRRNIFTHQVVAT